MRKTLYSIISLCLLASSFACVEPKKEETSFAIINDDLFVVDIDKAQSANLLYSSAICQDVKTIILETTTESIFGTIDRLQFFDNHICILNQNQTRGIFLFDGEGRFIRKIGKVGVGPDEYQSPLDFTVDIPNRHIYVLDANGEVYKYNYNDGKFIESFKINKDRNTASGYIQFCNGNLFADVLSFQKDENSPLLQRINLESGDTEEYFLNVNNHNKGWNESYYTEQDFFALRTDSAPRFFQLFMDTIFSIDKDKVMPHLVIKSKNWASKEIVSTLDIFNIDSRLHSTNKIHGIHCYVENDDFIIFKYSQGLDIHTIMYDKIGKKGRKIAIIDDFLYPDTFVKRKSFNSRFSGSQGMYVDMSADALLSVVDNMQPTLDKIEQLKKLPEDSNPILFFYRFR